MSTHTNQTTETSSPRFHALDAVRGFALLLGVVFHAALSFMPGWPPGLWAMSDNSPSQLLSDIAFVTHVFRMSVFFFIAGFFARLMHRKLGTGGFSRNRALRIGVPLVAGWVILYPAIQAIWIAGMTKSFGGTLPPMPEMPKVTGAFPLAHLWFLYQLLLTYAVALSVRALVDRFDTERKLRGGLDQLLSFSLRWPLAIFFLGVPLTIALTTLPVWFYWAGIPTPDQSLIPQLPATVGFGMAFAVGWLVQASPAALGLIERRWALHLATGGVAAAWLLSIVHTTPVAEPGLLRIVYAYVFGVSLWGFVFGLTGLALRYLSDYNATRRYIADASYWIYLTHLPVVMALQVWVGHWPLHWSVKFPLILAMSFAMLFASYHWLVRPTLIGELLNGRRYRRDGTLAPSPSSPARIWSPSHTGHAGPVAMMRGITKKFGATTALSDIDIDVRAGELLAVLGPNGAGKSTAISLWLGLIEPDAGEVTLLGGSPQDVVRRQGLGVMMQDVDLPSELTPRELVQLTASYYAQPLTVEEALRRAHATEFADRAYGKLSGGQKRLTQYAAAICGQPRVLFLDEPSVGLDVQAREALWDSVRGLLAAGCSIVLTTHYLEEAEALANRVAVIARGRLIALGTVDDMRALVSRRQITCESRLGAQEVGRWPGVVEARVERDRLHITAIDAENVVRRLLAEDESLGRLEVRQAGLNEAFTELTREAA